MTADPRKHLVFCEAPRINECMYTGRALDGSREHVLIDALGARLTSRELVCGEINNISSGTVDAALFQPYQFIAQQLGIRGKGSKSRVFRFQDANSDRMISIGADQIPRKEEKPRPSFYEEDGKEMFRLRGYSFDQLQSVIRSIVRGGDIAAHIRTLSITEEEPPTVTGSLQFDGLYTSGIRKAALNLVGYFDPGMVRSSCLLNSRQKVFSAMLGIRDEREGAVDVLFRASAEQMSDELAMPMNPRSPAHRIIVSADGARGVIMAAIDLFSVFNHALVLSENYAGPDRTFLYWCDPFGRSQAVVKTLDAAMTSLAHLKPECPPERVVARLSDCWRELGPAMRVEASVQALTRTPDDASIFHELIFPEAARIGEIDPSKFRDAARRLGRSVLNHLDVSKQIDKETRELIIDSASNAMVTILPHFSDEVFTAELRESIAVAWWSVLVETFIAHFPMLVRMSTRMGGEP